jgi:hypothetical protein
VSLTRVAFGTIYVRKGHFAGNLNIRWQVEKLKNWTVGYLPVVSSCKPWGNRFTSIGKFQLNMKILGFSYHFELNAMLPGDGQ